ncbi:MAG: hypothetical protein FK734_21460 [Asgard group archaeon]|nr:hypothetical protein [Asgard group archaeon]
MYQEINDEPRFMPKDYREKYDKPCIPEDLELDTNMEHYGIGIAPYDHPLNGHIPMRGCGNCNSDNVLVIYAQWNVSTHSGDSYWDYEIYCNDCHKYTSRSFAEND